MIVDTKEYIETAAHQERLEQLVNHWHVVGRDAIGLTVVDVVCTKDYSEVLEVLNYYHQNCNDVADAQNWNIHRLGKIKHIFHPDVGQEYGNGFENYLTYMNIMHKEMLDCNPHSADSIYSKLKKMSDVKRDNKKPR